MTDDFGAVHVHVHLVMGGAFPLRMADLLFTDVALVVPEYHYLTPLFGIARGKTHDVAESAVERYRRDGVAGLVDMAESTHVVAYGDIERVRVYSGRGLGRPKVAVDVADGPPFAYRVHAPVVHRRQQPLEVGALGRGADVTPTITSVETVSFEYTLDESIPTSLSPSRLPSL